MNDNIEARVLTFQCGTSRSRGADNRDRKTSLSCLRNQAGRQVAASDHGQTHTAEPSQTAQHTAVAEHTPRPFEKRLHGRRIII